MSVNLFPAILMAGPPHSGKSVLAYLLSQRLRSQSIAHYLLRADPGGEGDWFLEGAPGDQELVRQLRMDARRGYNRAFTGRMVEAIENRPLPLLVDVGGLPRGADQIAILQACTHVILLYRTPQEQAEWQQRLEGMGLQPVAELCSCLEAPECPADVSPGAGPVLHGTIAGLERLAALRRTGPLFDRLAERVAGICAYAEDYLETVHLSRARYPAVLLRSLQAQLGLAPQEPWKPEHLPAVLALQTAGEPRAIYGRGPVWLAAALAVRALPAPVELFDVRYGWLPAPGLGSRHRLAQGALTASLDPLPAPAPAGQVLALRLPAQGVLEPADLALPRLVDGAELAGNGPVGGLVLSGKLPRWAFAALARHYAAHRAWMGVYEPRMNRAIVIHSNSPYMRAGDTFALSLGSENPVDNVA